MEAALWYEQRKPGLGEEFITEVDQAIRQVLENPLAFRVIRRRHEVRRVLTHRFPYRIFFTLKGDTIFIHAVLHGYTCRLARTSPQSALENSAMRALGFIVGGFIPFKLSHKID
jgi:toxin ParE1/3/4